MPMVSGQAQRTGTRVVEGLHGSITIRRDPYGIPHVHAPSEPDAWFGMGFASAQDRLWQMEYDRRRAVGRWAEVVGPEAVPSDRLARRLQLEAAAHADVAVMSDPTRAMFEAYAAGVNAFLVSGHPLPVEYHLTKVTPEPWEPWQSVVSFKIRHVLMGTWQLKLAQAQLLALIGPDAYARLDGRPLEGSTTILPLNGRVRRLFEDSARDLRAAAAHLGFLAETDAGSNSWAVHGSRTTTGKPILCNDSHRQLDVPNVYWQVHLIYPTVDVVGAVFPGVPGFPHFGDNGAVAWSITHAMADYQDLYIEQFDATDPARYRTPTGWDIATHHVEEIVVRDHDAVAIEIWRTRHGPVVHGDPRQGYALALRYTATDAPCRTFEALRAMLVATTVSALHEAQRAWVDPVNNLVSADTAGTIGYLLRGILPQRSSTAHRQFPAPGWTGEHEWIGMLPFEQMPHTLNPSDGLIVTANQQILPDDEPYIADAFADPFRAARIRECLSRRARLSPLEVQAVQGDTTSLAARAWIRLCQRLGRLEGTAEMARAFLASWDGNLHPDSGPALLYGCFRRRVVRILFQPIVGAQAWEWMTTGEVPACEGMIRRWLANVVWTLDASATTPDGRPWTPVLSEALAQAWEDAGRIGGSSPDDWRWARYHQTNAVHTLATLFPHRADELNPPRVGIGGDSDTVQVATYAIQPGSRFAITGLPVYRQVVDFADRHHARYVIPGGSSGRPGTPHSSDQMDLWQTHQLIAMREVTQ